MSRLMERHVLIQSDNSTTVAHVNHQGDTRSVQLLQVVEFLGTNFMRIGGFIKRWLGRSRSSLKEQRWICIDSEGVSNVASGIHGTGTRTVFLARMLCQTTGL